MSREELIEAMARAFDPRALWDNCPNSFQQRRCDRARARAREALSVLNPLLERVAGEGALAELALHTNWELSYGYPDEEAEGEWQVHRVNGGVNDREWSLIGSGQTPETALRQAASLHTELKGLLDGQ